MTADNNTMTLKEAASQFGYKVPTLRAEADRGRLTIYRIGNKLYTTRDDIRAMVKACRVEQKAPASIWTGDDQHGLSATEHVSSARAALKAMLNTRGHS